MMIKTIESSLPVPDINPQRFYTKPIIVLLAIGALLLLISYTARSLWARMKPIFLYLEGKEAYGAQMFGKAINLFQRALQQNPNQHWKAKILVARAESYRMLTQLRNALQDLEEAQHCEIQGKLLKVKIPSRIADIYAQEGDYVSAIEKYKQVLESSFLLTAQKTHILSMRGLAYQKWHEQILMTHGDSHFAQTKLEKAFDDLTAAEQSPTQDQQILMRVLCQMAEMHAQRGEHREAIVKYQKALECRPLSRRDEADLYYQLGCAYIDLQEPELALANLTLAHNLHTNINLIANISLTKGVIKAKERNFVEAVKNLTEAIDLHPVKNLYQMHFARGQIYLLVKEMGKALTDFTAAFDLAPDEDAKALLSWNKACIYSNLGRLELAILECEAALRSHFERSVRRNPDPLGSGQDELSRLERKASLDAPQPQTDEETPPLQGGVLQNEQFDFQSLLAACEQKLTTEKAKSGLHDQ